MCKVVNKISGKAVYGGTYTECQTYIARRRNHRDFTISFDDF